MLFRKMPFICLKIPEQCVFQRNGLMIILLLALPISAHALTPVEDIELSEPVSIFIATANRLTKARQIGAPLYVVTLDKEKVLEEISGMVVEKATALGSPQPQSIGKLFLQVSKSLQVLSNYDDEVRAVDYMVGQLLEDKDMLPDADAAVEKANELVETIQERINALPTDHTWQQLFLAVFDGVYLFFDRNIPFVTADFVLMFKRFFEYTNRV